MMDGSFIAPTINLEHPDEISAKLNHVTKTIPAGMKSFLSNSFGFGGTNSSLIVRKFDGHL